MFLQRCRLLIKRIYHSFTMFNQDNLAAAQIAQIFGSELLKVQQNARTDGGSTPDIVKLDPKQFLFGQQTHQNIRKAEEQRIIQALQREAEAAYPVNEPSPLPPPSQPEPTPIPSSASSVSPPLGRAITNSPTLPEFKLEHFSSPVLERIAISLERIANAVDKVDVKTKKKTIKRSKPTVSKSILVNEITAK